MPPRGWKRWTPEELDRLRELFPDRPNAEIAAELGRSPGSIASMASDLRLRKSSARLRNMGESNRQKRRDVAGEDSAG